MMGYGNRPQVRDRYSQPSTNACRPYHYTHGGVRGVQHQLHLLNTSADPLSLDSAMIGIDKNKPFPHLFKSHNPVTLTSPLVRAESRAARDILLPSLEASGSCPPDIFAYHANIRPSFMALTFGAVVVASLQQHGTAAVTNWNAADAFLRCEQEDATALHQLPDIPWDFGPWAVRYYGRLRNHPLTEDGFAEPYVTSEAWNQGDNISGDAYQVGEVVVGGHLPLAPDIRIPPSPAGIPINNISFSDDRWLIRPTLTAVVSLTRLCTVATVAKGGLVHPDKLQFFTFDAPSGVTRQLTTTVPHYECPTSTASPQVVGIPLTADLAISLVFADLTRKTTRLCAHMSTAIATPVPALCSPWAYVLAKYDYIATGVAIDPSTQNPLPSKCGPCIVKFCACHAGRHGC